MDQIFLILGISIIYFSTFECHKTIHTRTEETTYTKTETVRGGSSHARTDTERGRTTQAVTDTEHGRATQAVTDTEHGRATHREQEGRARATSTPRVTIIGESSTSHNHYQNKRDVKSEKSKSSKSAIPAVMMQDYEHSRTTDAGLRTNEHSRTTGAELRTTEHRAAPFQDLEAGRHRTVFATGFPIVQPSPLAFGVQQNMPRRVRLLSRRSRYARYCISLGICGVSLEIWLADIAMLILLILFSLWTVRLLVDRQDIRATPTTVICVPGPQPTPQQT